MPRAILLSLLMTAIVYPQSTTPADYFPLEVGNRWEYQFDLSADRQIWQVSGQRTIKQNVWFVIDVQTQRKDAGGNIQHSYSSEMLVRMDGTRLLTRSRLKNQETVWVDFAAAPGLAYPSPGMCHSKATNSPRGDGLVVLYDRGCADAGLVDETFVTNVGLRSFTMDSFAGARSWTLIAGHVGGKDLPF